MPPRRQDDDPDKIDPRLIPRTARACTGCMKVKPLDAFPSPQSKSALCYPCTGLWMLYGERPTKSWTRYPCTGCEVVVRAPSRCKSARAQLCLTCYDGWNEFDQEVQRRRREGLL